MTEDFVASNDYAITPGDQDGGDSIRAIRDLGVGSTLNATLTREEVRAIAEFAEERNLTAPLDWAVDVEYDGAQPTLRGPAVNVVRNAIGKDWGHDFAMTAAGEVIHLPELDEFTKYQAWKRSAEPTD